MSNAPVVMVLPTSSSVLFKFPVLCPQCKAWTCRLVNRNGITRCSECEEDEGQPSASWYRDQATNWKIKEGKGE